jgi:hypothetical protein
MLAPLFNCKSAVSQLIGNILLAPHALLYICAMHAVVRFRGFVWAVEQAFAGLGDAKL